MKSAIRSFGRLPRIALHEAINQWRGDGKNLGIKDNSSKLMGMVASLHRIFTKKARRVLNPPMIVKDADEIMRRMIKRLMGIAGYL
mmetsp:Transcript_26696/g.4754  ORF Transcript_26696/g.4754 Transcript_26696/m.4754 type:complete len:86 (-) Transcript_26696:202-459(-)